MLNQVRVFISQLRGPFGFLSYDIEKAEQSIYAQEEAEAAEERDGDHARYAEERAAAAKFTMQVERIMQDIPQLKGVPLQWYDLTVAVTWIQLGLVVLCMLKRPCMLSLTVCCLALYVLHFP